MNTKTTRIAAATVAGLSLAVALGGTATAAGMVTSAQVKNNSLTSLDIKNNTIKTVDIKNGTIGLADLSPAAKSALKGQAGAAGADAAPNGFMSRINVLPITPTTFGYGFVNQSASSTPDVSDRVTLTPNVPITVTRMSVQLTAFPGAGSSRSFRLRVNGTDSLQVLCVVPSAANSCVADIPEGVTIPAESLVAVTTFAPATAPAAADALVTFTTERG